MLPAADSIGGAQPTVRSMPSAAATAASVLPSWLALERLTPFDAYAQAMGTAMLVIALLQWLCSFYSDARALRIFALLYLLTGLGWLVAHPRAHGGADDVPLLPAMVAVGLLGMNVWGLYEFLGLARRRAWALVGRSINTMTSQATPRSNLFQRKTTGVALNSAMPLTMRSFSSSTDLTRMCRRKVRAILEKAHSIRLSQEPCLGV